MIFYVFKKRKYLLSMLLLFGVYGVVLSLIELFWMLCKFREKRVFEKLDVIVG